MKANYIITLLTTIIVVSSTGSQTISLNSGWNLIGISESMSDMSLDVLIPNIDEKVSFISTNTNGWLTYDPAQSASRNDFSTFNVGKGYWIKATTPFDISLAGELLEYPSLSVGWNLVSFGYSNDVSTMITDFETNRGIAISFVSANNNGWLTYDPAQSASRNDFSTFDSTYGYWVKVSSINYDKFIQNALTSDAELTSYADLSNKSIVVMESNTTNLKASLITFNDNQSANLDYKEVELATFSISTLNGTDAEINATLTSQASSLTSGICGTWVWDGSSLNMTTIDNSNATIATFTVTNSTDGNFTVKDVIGGSIYKKVVYYGAAIDLDGITDCQVSDIPIMPTVPGF